MVKLWGILVAIVVAGRPFEDVGNDHAFVSQRSKKDMQKWRPIRIEYFLNWSNLHLSYLVKALPKALSEVNQYFAQSLAVHQYEGNLILEGARNCSHFSIPGEHVYEGVQADVIFYFNVIDSDSLEYGKTHICLYDATDRNPIAALITLNERRLTPKLNYLTPVLINLYAKGLGFGSYAYLYAKKPDGSLYNDNEMIYNDFDDFGKPIRRLKSPSVLSAASRIFQSDYPTGIPLSNDTADIEFSSRAMFGDIMSDSPPEFKYQFSTLSLSFFQDLGWYAVDFSRASTIVFGAKRDNFLEESCVNGNFPEFCNATASPPLSSCDAYHLNKATCSSSNFTAGCGIFVDFSHSGSCQGLTPIFLDPDQGEEACPDCRCFNSSVSTQLASDFRPMCYRVYCSDTTARVKVRDIVVECPPAGGNVSIPGSIGYMECPSFDILCGGFGCPSFCSAYGQCIHGNCKCEEPRFGFNCSLPCPERCFSCDQYGCSYCIANANKGIRFPDNTKCFCNSGYFFKKELNQCLPCSDACATCEETRNNCVTCKNNYLLKMGKCVCPGGSYLNGVGTCAICDQSCVECALSYENCLSCKPGFLHTEVNKCICPQGNFINYTDFTCLPCDSRCLSCTTVNKCTSCLSGFVLLNGLCESQEVEQGGEWGKCGECYWTCGRCGSKPNQCSTCINGLFSINSVLGICTLNVMRETAPGLSPTFPNFLTRDPTYKMECSGDVSHCQSILKRGYFFTGETYLKLGPNKRSEAVYLNPEFVFAAYVRVHPARNDTVLLSKVTDTGTEFITFGISDMRTLVLKLRMRSYAERLMCENKTVEISTDVSLKTDEWLLLWFQLETMAASGTSGTLVSLRLGKTMLGQTFYQEMVYEDIPAAVGHKFVVGGLWTDSGVQKALWGYLGEIAIRKGFSGEPTRCYCKQCTISPDVCLSDCRFEEQEVGSDCLPI